MYSRAVEIASDVRNVAKAMNERFYIDYEENHYIVDILIPGLPHVAIGVKRDESSGRFEASPSYRVPDDFRAHYSTPNCIRKGEEWNGEVVSTTWAPDRDPKAVARQISRRLFKPLAALSDDVTTRLANHRAYVSNVETAAERLREAGWEVRENDLSNSIRPRAYFSHDAVGSFSGEVMDSGEVSSRDFRLTLKAAVALAKLAREADGAADAA